MRSGLKKGPLRSCGPVHNQRLTQLRSVLLPVLQNPYPCVRQHGLHTVNGADDLARAMCLAGLSQPACQGQFISLSVS